MSETGLAVDAEMSVLREFEGILQTKLADDRRFFKEGDSSYRDFRVLKETLRSDEFNREKLGNKDLRDITDYLVNSEKYSDVFREWIEKRRGEWERNVLPQNTRRIYALGSKSLRNTG